MPTYRLHGPVQYELFSAGGAARVGKLRGKAAIWDGVTLTVKDFLNEAERASAPLILSGGEVNRTTDDALAAAWLNAGLQYTIIDNERDIGFFDFSTYPNSYSFTNNGWDTGPIPGVEAFTTPAIVENGFFTIGAGTTGAAYPSRYLQGTGGVKTIGGYYAFDAGTGAAEVLAQVSALNPFISQHVALRLHINKSQIWAQIRPTDVASEELLFLRPWTTPLTMDSSTLYRLDATIVGDVITLYTHEGVFSYSHPSVSDVDGNTITWESYRASTGDGRGKWRSVWYGK